MKKLLFTLALLLPFVLVLPAQAQSFGTETNHATVNKSQRRYGDDAGHWLTIDDQRKIDRELVAAGKELFCAIEWIYKHKASGR